MKELKIVLKITDPEVVGEYIDVDKQLLWEDLKDGSLFDFTEIVSVDIVKTKTKSLKRLKKKDLK
jgi:hypothetical protein